MLETVRGQSAEEALAAVLKAVTEFAGTEPPRDDLTVMVHPVQLSATGPGWPKRAEASGALAYSRTRRSMSRYSR